MEVIDLNGEGEWSRVRVCERHAAYCTALGIIAEDSLHPREYSEGDKKWIYPILDKLIKRIIATDPACIALGVDPYRRDQFLPFGSVLNAHTARALRRTVLDLTAKSPSPQTNRLHAHRRNHSS